MKAVAMGRQDRQTSEAGEALARVVVDLQAVTVAAFALSTGTGM